MTKQSSMPGMRKSRRNGVSKFEQRKKKNKAFYKKRVEVTPPQKPK